MGTGLLGFVRIEGLQMGFVGIVGSWCRQIVGAVTDAESFLCVRMASWLLELVDKHEGMLCGERVGALVGTTLLKRVRLKDWLVDLVGTDDWS